MRQVVTKISLTILATLCMNLNAFAAADTNQDVSKISKNTGLDPKVVELALKAKNFAANKTHVNQNLLTIVNFAAPAIQPRLYVIDLKDDSVVMKLRVAHGRNSGPANGIPSHFSNAPKSLESSLGVFVTGDTYVGHHGKSRHVIGLEPSNDNAMKRDIIIHSAPYVNSQFVGRSWGCFAVNPSDAPKLINLLSPGSVIFAYAPQETHDSLLVNQTI